MQEDRSIDITENITVHATGAQIKRGITRGFPTSRYNDDGRFKVKYKDISVTRNGEEDAFHSEDVTNGKILYIGKKDYFLPKGIHSYEINYTVPNQTDWKEEYAQLRWNSIGTDVEFETEKASVTLIMPDNSSLLETQSYIGKFGEQGNSARIQKSQNGKNEIYFLIENGLRPGEGVTSEIRIEKNAVLKPSILEKSGGLLALLLSSVIMLLYFVYTWTKYGRDPEAMQSGYLYSPPENLSPASMSYIKKGGYRSKALLSSILSLAVKGYIRVDRKARNSNFLGKSENFWIQKMKDVSNDLPDEEQVIMHTLFASNDEYLLDGEYDATISTLQQAHQSSITSQHKAFVKEGSNLKFVLFPILLTILTIILSLILSNVFGLGSYNFFTQLPIYIVIAVIAIAIYRYLIIQPTVEKVHLQSKIQGFKNYIEGDDKARANMQSVPDKDVDHFEKLFPYAFALGVEKNWSSLFTEYLKAASYEPNWGDADYVYGNGFNRQFSDRMNSASYKPSSGGGMSSGSSGGGFSGGGGGGGSVGGW